MEEKRNTRKCFVGTKSYAPENKKCKGKPDTKWKKGVGVGFKQSNPLYLWSNFQGQGCDVPFDFALTRGLQLRDCHESQKDFGLLNSVETVIDFGNFQSWTECIFAL